MLRRPKNIHCFALFNNFARLHHANPIRDFAHNAEIMRDEQKTHPFGFFQFGQKIKDLRLNGDIKRSGWLICDQKIRPVGQGHCNHHALPLSA